MRRLLCVASIFAACSSPPKTTPLPDPGPDPVATKTQGQLMVENLAALRWSELGHPVIRWDAIPTVEAPKEAPHKLLVVLVEFDDYRFERFGGDRDQGDKLAAYYQEQLFDGDYARKDSLSHYYLEQSNGAYHVDGIVLPPVRLPKPRRAYGSPNRPAGGDWRDDVDTEGMVEAALKLAAKSADRFPAAEFDRWDPSDYDKDGITAEPDGYLDHFVMVYAGAAQNSCQLLNKIRSVLTPNVGNEALTKLDKQQRECADRLWPHRSAVRVREGQGPKIADGANRRGGVPLSETLWVYDYNMQSEYTDAATFIHEFGHSIGLPDVYSRSSSNSTGSWAVMSSDMRPSPQGMSSWSRLQLGWLKPEIILPPDHGGAESGSVKLARLDDRGAAEPRALLAVLPPKKKILELTDTLPEGSKVALYGGQGNEMSRTAAKKLDLSEVTSAQVMFDAWWEIEAGWDFAYVEVSDDGGKKWTRQVPTNREHMPAKHGHDGKQTTPGFTGISGDLNGDGKNESNKACDPKVEIKSGEDKTEGEENPCLVPSWVTPSFDLSAYAGKSDVRFRLRYYTDGAAVMRGILFDNVSLQSKVGDAEMKPVLLGNFESGTDEWELDGFSASPGRHEILVPHYYLLEYRDPYQSSSYDASLQRSSIAFYAHPDTGEMHALEVRRRPGVVVWYGDGAFAWSENDPAINGAGKGYALVVDSNPNELLLPGLEPYFTGAVESFNTSYDISSDEAQKKLKKSFKDTICFVRSRAFQPRGLKLGCKRGKPPVQGLTIDGKKATYVYEVLEQLPGSRESMRQVQELIDTRTRKGVLSYRLRDRGLRYYHTFDAPFSSQPFADGVIIHRVGKSGLERVKSWSYEPTSRFDDREAARWLNPKLPFGGSSVAGAGFTFEVVVPEAGGPAELRYQYAK